MAARGPGGSSRKNLAGSPPLFRAVVAHRSLPLVSFNSDSSESFFGSLMFQKLWKQRMSIFLLLDGSPRGGELAWGYFIRFPPRLLFESHGVSKN